MSQRVDAPYLDAFAASFLVLGRLHLGHATTETRHDIYTNLLDWPYWREPFPINELSDLHAEALVTKKRGTALLKQSWESREDDETIRMDQDFLYGVSASARVSPYESVHVGEDHLVFDDETIQVRLHYARLGLQAPRLHAEPDDHIGLEFDFFAQACLQMLGALDEKRLDDYTAVRDITVTFTREHPLRWIPAMLRQAEAQAQTYWMRGVEALSYATFASWCEALSVRGLIPPEIVLEGFAASHEDDAAGHEGDAAGQFGDPDAPEEPREAGSAATPTTGKPSEPGNPGDHATENPTL